MQVKYMYKFIPKRNFIRRTENDNNPAFRNMIITLELCKEADDYLWKQLLICHLDDLEILNSKEGRLIKKRIMRKLKHGI